MEKRLILIGPQEADVFPGEERAVQLEKGIFSERFLGDPQPGCLVSSACLLGLPAHLGTRVGVRGAGLRAARWTQGRHDSSRPLAVLLTLDRPSRNPESVILGEGTAEASKVQQRMGADLSRSHLAPPTPLPSLAQWLGQQSAVKPA